MRQPPRSPDACRTAPVRATFRRTAAGAAAAVAAAMLVAGCAHFSDATPTFSQQPSLQPTVATVLTPGAPAAGPNPSPGAPTPRPSQTSGSPSGPPPSGTARPADPCGPSPLPVVATCLSAPWGLAPLPDGASALVGERTTGKILLVAPGKAPSLVATVTGIDTAGGGGLLGIALSPYYPEDGLIYAYVSTPTDNRIVRIAAGEAPKAIFTGIPHGTEHNGGPIAFGADDLLYVATGDAGDPHDLTDPRSLGGKVLRLDAFGKPAGTADVTGTPGTGPGTGTGTAVPHTATTGGTAPAGPTGTAVPHTATTAPAVYASGLTDPTGMCPLPGGRIGVVDHRGTGDALIPVGQGKDYADLHSGDVLWSYQPGDGGAVDCAVASGDLLATSLDAQKLTSIQMLPTGGFTGSPSSVAQKAFGRLRTVVTGPGGLIWLTTSNKDGHGTPVPSDDRVVVLPPQSGGGGGGVD